MNMLIQLLLNRQTATQFAVKENKTSLRSSFVSFHLEQINYFLKRKQVMRAKQMRSDITCFGVGVEDTYINQLNENTK